MKLVLLAAAAIAIPQLAHCAPDAAAFEVASIRPCPPGTPPPPGEHAGNLQFVFPGGRFEAKCVSPEYLFEWAYDIQPAQHSRFPDAVRAQRYEILAKSEGDAAEAEMKRMLRTLLAERFRLEFHIEKRELPVYIVSLEKTPPKLLPASKDSEPEALEMTREQPLDQKFATVRVSGRRYTMTGLTDVFSRQLDRLIVDRTGIPGEFDFAVELTPDETRPSPLDPATVILAITEQLNLKFQAGKAVIDYYAIDWIEPAAAN